MWERQSGEDMLPREQSDKRQHSPQLHNGRARGSEGILPKLLACKCDSGTVALSDLQES